MRTNECPSDKILYECEDDILMCCQWNHIGSAMNRAQKQKLKEDITLPEFGDCERVSSEEDGDSGYLRGSDMVSYCINHVLYFIISPSSSLDI